jgi:hypothetical protein
VRARFASDGCSLTWGICRPNLRNQLRVSDAVVFFAVEDFDGEVGYRFSGYATVARKVSQDQIWQEDELAVYRDYLNLLVEPAGEGCFRHAENHPGGGHHDWLWRLVRSAGYPWKKADFAPWEEPRFEKTIIPGVSKTAGGQPIRFARNYVIFEREPPQTLIAADPPLIAVSPGRREPEIWLGDDFAVGLRRLTVGECPDRTLRTTAPRNQHPFIRLDTSAIAWREGVARVVAEIPAWPLIDAAGGGRTPTLP